MVKVYPEDSLISNKKNWSRRKKLLILTTAYTSVLILIVLLFISAIVLSILVSIHLKPPSELLINNESMILNTLAKKDLKYAVCPKVLKSKPPLLIEVTNIKPKKQSKSM